MRAFAIKKNKSRKNFNFQVNYVCRKLINGMSSKGKKAVCERLFAKTLVHLSRETKAPLNYFIAAISNIVPFVEIKTLRQGNRITKIAVPLNEKRGLNIAFLKGYWKNPLWFERLRNFGLTFMGADLRLVVTCQGVTS